MLGERHPLTPTVIKGPGSTRKANINGHSPEAWECSPSPACAEEPRLASITSQESL